MDALSNALAFASLKHAVLALHGVVKRDGAWCCTCGDASCGASAGKHPRTPHGLKDASTSPRTIKGWHRAAPDINFGVSTRNLVVLDVDGDAGRASLARLEEQHGALPRTWRASTGSGRSLRFDGQYSASGQHIYFKPPRGKEVRSSVGALAEGLDVRAQGGYCVIPGSLHVTGVRYTWLPEWHPNDCDLAPCPAWLLKALTEPKHNGPRPIEEYRALAAGKLHEGKRNAGLVRLAGHLLANFVDPGVVHELMQGWNRGQCAPPLPAAEVERSVASIALAELRKRGVRRG